MCLWVIYIFPWSGCLFCCRKIQYVDRSWEYKKIAHRHMNCGNWDWGRATPFLGIHKWDFCCSVYTLYNMCTGLKKVYRFMFFSIVLMLMYYLEQNLYIFSHGLAYMWLLPPAHPRTGLFVTAPTWSPTDWLICNCSHLLTHGLAYL